MNSLLSRPNRSMLYSADQASIVIGGIQSKCSEDAEIKSWLTDWLSDKVTYWAVLES